MRVAVAFLFVALLACVQARSFDSVQQSDDGTTVVRMHFESNDDSDEQPVQMTQSAFSSPFSILNNLNFFSRPEPQSEQPRVFITSGLLNNDFEERRSSMSRMFDNLFRFSSFGRSAAREEEDDSEGPSIISFEMEPTVTFADEQEDQPEPDLSAPLSRMFARMNSLLHPFFQSSNDQFFRTQETNVPKSARRGGCTLLQRCASDIERLCASAKRINIAQAIPRCLARHRDELSEPCGDYMDRRAAGLADDDTEEESEETETESSETVTSEETTEATPMVPVPAEASEPAIPSDPREACHLAVSSLCPSVNHENMVDLMSCLHSHQSEVNSVCLNHVKETAAFACAEDAQKLCPGVTERRAVGRCLKEHVTKLSSECVAATRPKSPRPTSIKVDNLSERVAVPATPSLAANNKQTYMIAGGLVGLVALVVVGAIVVARRRRRTASVKAVVQLVNPNHQNSAVGAVEPASSDTYSAAFGRELRPEEQL